LSLTLWTTSQRAQRMNIEPFSQATGLTGDTLRPPQRLQVHASLRVRRGLLLFGEAEAEEAEREGEELGAARPPLVPRWKTRGEEEAAVSEAEGAAGAAALFGEEDDSTTEYSVTSKKAAAETSASPPAAGRMNRDAAVEAPLRAGGPERGLKREGESRDRTWSLSASLSPPSGPPPGLEVLANAGGRGEGTRPGPPRRGRWTTKFCLFCFVLFVVLAGGCRGRKIRASSAQAKKKTKPQLGQRRASSKLFFALFLFYFGGREPLDVMLPLELQNTAKTERGMPPESDMRNSIQRFAVSALARFVLFSKPHISDEDVVRQGASVEPQPLR